MPRSIPTPVGHFTHIDQLSTIATRGLMSDTRAQAEGLLTTEAGNVSIKARRRERPVSAGPGVSFPTMCRSTSSPAAQCCTRFIAAMCRPSPATNTTWSTS
ncbi:DUF4433 domain-containing protein [Rhodococcus hoagii]|nr:DUF4433 domain-containing protein [Prescottella equi]